MVVQGRYSHLDLASAAWRAGNIAVQYRNKAYLHEIHREELNRMGALAQEINRILIVNDRVDLTMVCGAAGVHLGQEDTAVSMARELLGIDALIGATVHSIAEQEGLRGSSADYVGIGPVFGTQSKTLGLPPLGLDGLAMLVEKSAVPVIAIGNIQLENIPAVMGTGVYGIAVISAYCMADDLESQAKLLLEAVESHV
jgi:thiamine-phosphate pyrophosphorylase